MGVREKIEVEQFLASLGRQGEPAEHLVPRASSQYLNRVWYYLLASTARARGRQFSRTPDAGFDLIVGELKKQDFQSMLSTTVDQLHVYLTAAGASSPLKDPLGETQPHSKKEELGTRIQNLEARVARLEQRPELPIHVLPDEGDPFELLRQLRTQLGEERFLSFTKAE